MADPNRRQAEEFKSEQRSNSTSYWKNEPGFGKARQVRQQDNPPADTNQTPEVDAYYANQGWSRSAAKEWQRDWGYTNDHNHTRDEPLYIDFHGTERRESTYDPGLAKRDEEETE